LFSKRKRNPPTTNPNSTTNYSRSIYYINCWKRPSSFQFFTSTSTYPKEPHL